VVAVGVVLVDVVGGDAGGGEAGGFGALGGVLGEIAGFGEVVDAAVAREGEGLDVDALVRVAQPIGQPSGPSGCGGVVKAMVRAA
jgi:hypothetical protein